MSAVTRLGLALVVLWLAWTPAVDDAQAPARIISLVPAVTEMLFAIGAGDRVVGVSSYDRFPPEATTRAKVGALVDPDFERILSLRPDLVVVYGTQDDLMARLARASVPMFRYVHAGLADVTQTVRAIGDRVGRADAASALADQIGRDLDAVRARVAGRPRLRTALLFGREAGALRAMFASAGVGFMHDLLEVAGGDDVFADVKRQSLQVSSEQLLSRRPEVIIEVHPAEGWTPQRIATELTVWKSLTGVPAVRANRVHILADDRIAVPGPRVGEVAIMFANVLHPGTRR
jgi:iron complex transport system substrate-binding protein